METISDPLKLRQINLTLPSEIISQLVKNNLIIIKIEQIWSRLRRYFNFYPQNVNEEAHLRQYAAAARTQFFALSALSLARRSWRDSNLPGPGPLFSRSSLAVSHLRNWVNAQIQIRINTISTACE